MTDDSDKNPAQADDQPSVISGAFNAASERDVLELKAMIRSGDMFITIATQLETLEENAARAGYPVPEMDDYVEKLLYLQRHYLIMANDGDGADKSSHDHKDGVPSATFNPSNEQDILALDAMIQAGDLFITMAMQLEALEQNVARAGYPIPEMDDQVKKLRYMQDHYRTVKRDRPDYRQ